MKKIDDYLNRQMESIFVTYERMHDKIFLKEKIDWQNLDAQKWLRTIASTKNYLELNPGQRRAIRKLHKIAKNVRIETGYYLFSQFQNTEVVRNNVVTNVIDGKELDDFSCNPYDMDYGILLPNEIDKVKDESNKAHSKKPKWTVCSVTTHDAAQPPVCTNCGGKGFFRCEMCDGSGREQYVDGYYASGEERIKTGQCSNCYGTGKIQCDACTGTGKIQLFSKQYQIVKSFEDIEKITNVNFINNSWSIKSDFVDFLYQLFCFNNDEINKLFKNQKEVLIDGSQTIPNEIPEACVKLYELNKQAALEYFETNSEGKMACLREVHFAVPAFHIFYSYEMGEYEFEHGIDVYEVSGSTRCIIHERPELSFFKSLFV